MRRYRRERAIAPHLGDHFCEAPRRRAPCNLVLTPTAGGKSKRYSMITKFLRCKRKSAMSEAGRVAPARGKVSRARMTVEPRPFNWPSDRGEACADGRSSAPALGTVPPEEDPITRARTRVVLRKLRPWGRRPDRVDGANNPLKGEGRMPAPKLMIGACEDFTAALRLGRSARSSGPITLTDQHSSSG